MSERGLRGARTPGRLVTSPMTLLLLLVQWQLGPGAAAVSRQRYYYNYNDDDDDNSSRRTTTIPARSPAAGAFVFRDCGKQRYTARQWRI